MEGSDGSRPWDSYREGLEISGPSCCRYSPAIWRLHNASIQREIGGIGRHCSCRILDQITNFDRRGPVKHQLKHHDHKKSWQDMAKSSHQKTSVTHWWYKHGTTPSSYGSFSTPGQILGVGVPSNSQVRTSWCSCQIRSSNPGNSLGTTWPKTSQWNPLNPLKPTSFASQNWGFPAKFARESPENYADCRDLVAKHCYQSVSKFYLFHISRPKKGSGICAIKTWYLAFGHPSH